MNLLVRIILWLEGKIQLIQFFPGSTSLLILFCQAFNIPNVCFEGGLLNSLLICLSALSKLHTRLQYYSGCRSCNATLQTPFLLHFHLIEFGHCDSIPYWRFWLTLPKTISYSLIYRMSDPISSVQLYISFLHTLIVCRPISLLILIILIRPCVFFLLMW